MGILEIRRLSWRLYFLGLQLLEYRRANTETARHGNGFEVGLKDW